MKRCLKMREHVYRKQDVKENESGKGEPDVREAGVGNRNRGGGS